MVCPDYQVEMLTRPSCANGAGRAFTLIECLVAIAVLALASVAVSSALLGGIAAQEDALRLTAGTAAAESRVNELLATDYDEIVPGTAVEVIGSMSHSTGRSPAGFVPMGRRTIIAAQSLAIPGYTGLVIEGFQIDVTVFDQGQGEERQLASISRFRPHSFDDDEDEEGGE
ncbi:MAG: type II secretion system protein [Phycisphaerales bacterium]|nr:type II secretion system protein [Phycisphaerales bacterium]